MKRQIFVFGSNRQGRHGKGAALEARLNHGAVYGQSSGIQGNSYGIVTKELRRDYPEVERDEIAFGVDSFIEFAIYHKDLEFNVTPIGCGLAGFTPEQIASLFANSPDNVKLPREFRQVLDNKNK